MCMKVCMKYFLLTLYYLLPYLVQTSKIFMLANLHYTFIKVRLSLSSNF